MSAIKSAPNEIAALAAAVVEKEGQITEDNEMPMIAAAQTSAQRQSLLQVVDTYQAGGKIDKQSVNDLTLAAFNDQPVTADDLAKWHTPLAESWPASAVYTTQTHGLKTPAQFNIYDGKWGALGGTYDLQGVQKYLQGSGYKALVGVMPDGKEVAFGQMLINAASKTSMGRGYNEMIPCIFTVPDSTPDADARMPYANSAADVLGLYKGATLFATKPILDDQAAVDFGRELMGFDKSLGHFDIRESDDHRDFTITDENNLMVIGGRLLTRPTPAQAKASQDDVVAAANAAGIPLSVLATPPPPTATSPIASRIPGSDVSIAAAPGSVTQPTVHTGLALGSFNPVSVSADAVNDLKITWGPSPWAELIHGQLGFTPNESITTQQFQAALSVKVP